MTDAETPKHGTLAEALLAFQAEAPKMFKGSTAKIETQKGGYTYKYIALDDVMTIIQPLLTKHKLVFTSAPSFAPDGRGALEYRLIHAGTGERLEGSMPLMEKAQDPQSLGGAITYMRRYALTAVLNLVADDDDDAQRASAPTTAAANGSASKPTAEPSAPTERAATAKQRSLLNAKAGAAGLPPSDYANAILAAAGQDLRDFDSQDAAAQFVNRQLDRLPARLVDAVLAEIQKLGATA